MRSLLALLFLITLTSVAFAQSPFRRAEHDRFSKVENEERLLKLAVDFSETNVVSGGTLALAGSIPADSIVTSVSVTVTDTLTSASDNTVALGCGSADDLDAAVDLTAVSDNAFSKGVPRPNDEDTWVYTANTCTPTLTIGSGATGITAGRILYYIKYIQREIVRLYE